MILALAYVSYVVAVEEIGVPNWVGELAFGAVVILALLGHIWFKPAVSDLQARLSRVESQRDTLIDVHRNETAPALRQAISATEATVKVLDQVQPLLSALHDAQPDLREIREAVPVLRDLRSLLAIRGKEAP